MESNLGVFECKHPSEKCEKDYCERYAGCWFLRVLCTTCNTKVDVRDCVEKTNHVVFTNTHYDIQEHYCPVCNSLIW